MIIIEYQQCKNALNKASERWVSPYFSNIFQETNVWIPFYDYSLKSGKILEFNRHFYCPSTALQQTRHTH